MIRLAFLIALAALAPLPVRGAAHEHGAPAPAVAAAPVYTCVMHSQVRRDRPGQCPICGMELTILESAGAGASGTVHLTDRQIQHGGIRTGSVRRRRLVREVDAAARVEADERRLARIAAPVGGRIESLHVSYAGQRVAKGQLLAELFSPELESSVAALRGEAARFLAEKDPEGSFGSSAAETFAAARRRLVAFGLSEEDVDRLARGKPDETVPPLPVRAPFGGTVLERLVERGQWVERGTEMARLVDLSSVWVVADVYADEATAISKGQAVSIEGSGLPAGGLEGRVAFVDPVVGEAARTARVRVDLPNPHGALRPGAYVRARIRSPLRDALSVPESAVVHSGRRHVAFLAEGEGRFRPVEVQLGARWMHAEEKAASRGLPFGAAGERYHEVISGLDDGNSVVVAGTFLLAAESQFQGALTKMLEGDAMESDSLRAPEAAASPTKRSSAGRTAPGWLADYLALADALSADDSSGVSGSARALARSARSAPGGLALAEAASSLAAATELPAAREIFQRLSRLAVAASGWENDAHLFRCPMVKGYGYWLQRGEKVRNPYFGAAMLTCGVPGKLSDAR